MRKVVSRHAANSEWHLHFLFSLHDAPVDVQHLWRWCDVQFSVLNVSSCCKTLFQCLDERVRSHWTLSQFNGPVSLLKLSTKVPVLCWCSLVISSTSNIFLQSIEHGYICGQPGLCGPWVTNCGPVLKSSKLYNLHLPTICPGWHRRLFTVLFPLKLACTLSRIMILCSYGVFITAQAACLQLTKKAHPLHYYSLSQSLLWMLFTFMEGFVVLSMTCIWTFNDSVTVLLPVL